MPIYFRNAPVSEPFTIDSIGNRWNQNRIVRPKGHAHYHYLQTEKGCGKVEALGKNFILEEGEGILIAPFVPHAYAKETEEWYTSFAAITGTIESSIPKMLGNRQVILTGKEQGAKISALLSTILKQHENPPVHAKEQSIDCYRLLMYFVDVRYTHRLMNDPLYKRYVEPVILEMETHYPLELTVRELSRQVYITPQYLSRLFTRYLGCSPYEYLTTYRINKAKEYLLTDTRLNVQEIGRRVGFGDASHFIALFKNITGFTPLEFRKLN